MLLSGLVVSDRLEGELRAVYLAGSADLPSNSRDSMYH